MMKDKRKLSRRELLKTAVAGAISVSVPAICGCAEGSVFLSRDWNDGRIISEPTSEPSVNAPKKHLYLVGFDGWGDLWLKNDLHTLMKEVYARRKDVAGIVVDSVHQWERNVKKVRELVGEYKQRKEELRFGSLAFSAGGDQAYRALEELNGKVDFDFAMFYDYTETGNGLVAIPPNVKVAVHYLSRDSTGLLSLVTGNENNFKARTSATRVVTKRVPGTHLNFVRWPNVGQDLAILIEGVHSGALDKAYDEVANR